MQSEEAVVRIQYIVFAVGVATGFIVSLLTYVFIFPVLVNWGFQNEAFGVLMASFFLPIIGIFVLFLEVDTRRSLARKKSLLTGVMIPVQYGVWVKTHNTEKPREKRFDQGTTEIDLNFKKVRSIDLSVLADFPNLEHLDLSNNEITQIDLYALSQCKNLQSLILSRNRISEIDLSPLGKCKHLHTLYLADNGLKNIDLYPLVNCRDLMFFHLQENQLHSIDLKPLELCTKLVNLFLDDNPIEELDITPLRDCMKFDVVSFGDTRLFVTKRLDGGKWPQVISEMSDKIEYRGKE